MNGHSFEDKNVFKTSKASTVRRNTKSIKKKLKKSDKVGIHKTKTQKYSTWN